MEELAKQLPEADLRLLIKGLVLTSTGGSTTLVPHFYYVYARRFPEREPRLTEWIIDNRINEYDPFCYSTRRYGSNARSYAEFLHVQEQRRQESEERQRRQEEIAEEKRERDKQRATKNIANAVKRGDLEAVISMLSKGADITKALPNGGSLLSLAEANGRELVAEYLRSHGIT